MDKHFNPFSHAPANEYTSEDLEMINAFFESSKFKDRSLHQQYVEKCRPKSHAISARTKALRTLLEEQQVEPLGTLIDDTDFDSEKHIKSSSPTSTLNTTLPRKRTIKRKHRNLRLTIEGIKRSLLRQRLAKQVHKQNLRSTETIMMNVIGSTLQPTSAANNEAPGVHILPKGLLTEEYKVLCKAKEDLVTLIETEKGPARHFEGQNVLLIVKLPILLSSRIKGKLRVTGGLLVFNSNNAAVFCTIFSTPLEYRKFTANLSKLCSTEHHQFTIVFAGNRYLHSDSLTNKLDFTVIQQKKLEKQIICTSLRLDISSNSSKATASTIEKVIFSELNNH